MMQSKFYREHGLRITAGGIISTEEPENTRPDPLGGLFDARHLSPEFRRRLVACWNACHMMPIEEIEEKASYTERNRQLIHCDVHRTRDGAGAIVHDCPGCKANALSSGITEEQWAEFGRRQLVLMSKHEST
jgi:hypothetical protein